jgi:D-inositol-3-phosphate glycosyltransferase
MPSAATRPIKVLHFCPLPLFSGLEQYALMLAVEQKRRGHDVEFVALKGSMLEEECTKAGIKTNFVEGSWTGTLNLARQYVEILGQKPNLDIIHLHTSHDIDRVGFARQALRFSKNWKRPKIIQQNHIWISHSKKDPLHWISYRLLDEVWCSSRMAKKDLERFLPVPTKKIQVVPYGRDLGLKASFLSRDQARKELGLSPGETVIGAIARIDRAKGIWEMLQGAIACLKAGLDFTLVVIGGPTLSDAGSIQFANEVEALVKNLAPELAGRIRLAGGIPNAGRLLKAFDVYMQASYKETFSLALLDAQLAELPVIGTNSGGTPEVVREGETGWLGAPESSETMADAITRALKARDSWQVYGQAARRRVENDYALERVIDQILERYRKLAT